MPKKPAASASGHQFGKWASNRCSTNSCAACKNGLISEYSQLRLQQVKQIGQQLHLWELPIGWNTHEVRAGEVSGAPRSGHWFWMLLGWIASGLAISVNTG